MRRRLQERTKNHFGKQPEEVELMLRLNRNDENRADPSQIYADLRAIRRTAEAVMDGLEIG